MRWNREEYIELMSFGKSERPMFSELFGLLIGLDEEWRAQGVADNELNLTAFDFDYVPFVECGANTGLFGGYTPSVIEENDEYSITRDSLGRTMKLMKKYATIPLPLDYPVKDMDSWLKVKPFFEFSENRINWNRVENAKEMQKSGAIVLATMPGGFDMLRELMGEENLCIAYYDDPELVRDIIATLTDTTVRTLDRVSDKLQIDNLFVHEDMAGKSGPLVGPNIVEEYIAPYYRSVWNMLSSKGTKLFSQDSDGNMNPLIDSFLDAGVNIMFPMEPAAGMDIVEVRKKYGKRLALKGGIDKHVLRKTKNDILRELEYKLQPMMREGTVLALDHRIPNGTPLENYRFYVETAREILGMPKRNFENKENGRMAF